MHFLNRFAAAIMVLAFSAMLGSVPAWSKFQKMVIKGHTFFFDFPSGFSMERSSYTDMVSFHSDGYQNGDSILIQISELGTRMDMGELLGPNGEKEPVQHRGQVTFGVSGPDEFPHVMVAYAPCGEECFVYVDVTTFGSSKRAQGESMFEGYIQALASHSFEAPGAATSASTSGKPAVAEGNWLVIAGSWPTSQQGKVTARLKLLSENGITAKAVKTDNYSALTPGLVAIVLGPTSRESALAQLQTVQSVVPDAFIKESP
jgi:hypothetical protein